MAIPIINSISVKPFLRLLAFSTIHLFSEPNRYYLPQSSRWAMKGKPLYYWVKDTKPGDKTGDGFNKVWQVAKP